VETTDLALEKARSLLRAEQRRVIDPRLLDSTDRPVTDAALARYKEFTRVVPDEASGRLRRGAFTYDPELERKRIARGEALIRRVEPGPFEDPSYFASLAYQAASIELAYEGIARTSRRQFSKFLLGTAGAADVNAFATRLGGDGYTIVVLNSGLVDLIYQAAKVVVEALDHTRLTEGPALVRTVVSEDAVEAKLASDPRAADRLYRTLEAYFFKGYPRAISGEAVPEEQHPPLSLIVDMAERWVIGHEYGHGLAPSRVNVPSEVNVRRAEEYFADANATFSTVWSAGWLDVVSPEVTLGGPIFALACLDLLQRGLNVLRTGDEQGSDEESLTHPAFRDRASMVISSFRQFFDVEYHQKGLFELWLRDRPVEPETHAFSDERKRQAYAPANVLQTVWGRAKERLLDDYRRARPLHPMWRPASVAGA
jgi:hypothetical protein